MTSTGRVLAFLAITCCVLGEASIFNRVKRQSGTVVGSQSQTNGVGDEVETEAMAHHYKNTDGVIGMNVSSGGNSTGSGQTSLDNNASGLVGNTALNATGNVNSYGQDSFSHSDIFAAIRGENKSIASFQQGSASGTGDTMAQANGGAVLSIDGQQSPTSNSKNQATAGATGSLGSKSEVLSNQVLTWDTLLAQLVGSAVAEGNGNAQANVDLGAGNADNGVEMNGLVSGIQTGGGNVNAQVNGNANMNGSQHDLVGNMYGKVNGTSGNSTLVGASHIQSNSSGTNTSMSAFGDSKINSDGNSAIDLNSQTGLDNQKGVNGDILMNATDHGKNHSMTVQNGLKVNDDNGGTLAIGNGGVQGHGSENSNASITVNTNYTQDGEAKVVVKGEGQAIGSDNKNSSLSIDAHGDLQNSNGLNSNSSASSNGAASGQFSNMTGNSFISMDGGGSNGNAMMDAWGGGQGNSSVNTNTGLTLNDGGIIRNMTVNGGVSASGDKTQVHSSSVVTDYAGQQSLANYQQAISSSKGSSSASASNFGVLKRKKRASLGVLFDHLF